MMTLEQVRDELREKSGGKSGDYQLNSGECEILADAIDHYLSQPRPVAQGEAVAGLECPGITSWNSFCKNCKAPAHVCFDTNCNGSGSGYEAVGNVTHKCKCGPTIPTGHRVVPVVLPDEIGLSLCAPISLEWMAERTGYRNGWNSCINKVLELNAAPDAGGV